MSRPLYAIILAAGRSSRLGQPKQLIEVDGDPLVAAVVRQIAEAGVDRVVTVTGHADDRISAALRGTGTEVVFNPEWEAGMGSSVAAGLRRDARGAGAVLIALTDQPKIGVEHYRELVRRYRVSGKAAATGYPDGTCGVPAVFPEEYFEELASLSGDAGAKRILEQNRDRVEVVPNRAAALDIDVPEDLRR